MWVLLNNHINLPPNNIHDKIQICISPSLSHSSPAASYIHNQYTCRQRTQKDRIIHTHTHTRTCISTACEGLVKALRAGTTQKHPPDLQRNRTFLCTLMNPDVQWWKLLASLARPIQILDLGSLCGGSLCGPGGRDGGGRGCLFRAGGGGGCLFLGDDVLQFLGRLRVVLHPLVCRVVLQPVRPFDLLVQAAQQVFQTLLCWLGCWEESNTTYV